MMEYIVQKNWTIPNEESLIEGTKNEHYLKWLSRSVRNPARIKWEYDGDQHKSACDELTESCAVSSPFDLYWPSLFPRCEFLKQLWNILDKVRYFPSRNSILHYIIPLNLDRAFTCVVIFRLWSLSFHVILHSLDIQK